MILFYKSKNMAYANIKAGGRYGSSIKYFNNNEYKDFVNKMTIINRSRCQSDEFKTKKSKYMKQKYSNKAERIKQSDKLKTVWNNEKLRAKQSKIITSSYTAELRNIRKQARQKRTLLILDDTKYYFESLFECCEFLKTNYNFTPCRRTIIKLLHGEVYNAYHKKFKSLNGLRIMYV